MNFFEDTDDKEYKYKILVWPNWTYQKNLNADSFTIVIRNVINVLPKNIHWTIPTPYNVTVLNEFDNVEQVIYKFPSYPNTMRCDFNSDKFLKLLDWKNKDWDVIYSHLPEHTAQIANTIYNNTNISPKIVGYCHWYEVDENTNYDKRLINQNLLGTLEMDECGVNTAWLRDLVLSKCSDTFNQDVLDKLQTIIQPHYLGIDNYDFDVVKKIPNSILFNHRPNEYTGWKKFLDVMDEIYEQRQDFKVYGTLIEAERPYIERVRFPERKDYLQFIKKMVVGIGFFQTYSAWSISTTDGMSRGIPYLVPNKLCYPELMGHNYPLFYSDVKDFKSKLIDILDDNNNPVISDASMHIQKRIVNMTWDKQVSRWFDNWSFLENLPIIKEDTTSYQKIVKFIKTNKNVSKRDILNHMNWSVRIGYTGYRNRLRNEPNIKFTKDRYIYKNLKTHNSLDYGTIID